MSKKPRKPSNNTKDFSNKIIKILTTNSNRAFNYKQIAAILEVDDTKSSEIAFTKYFPGSDSIIFFETARIFRS